MLWFDLHRTGRVTLTRQLYDQLVTRILTGELRAGTRLPSTRQVANEYRVARNLVINVYDQLIAEGYLEPRAGAGTSVAALRVPPTPASVARTPAAPVPATGAAPPTPISFATGVPDLQRMPRSVWLAEIRRAGFFGPDSHWAYAPPGGDPMLRAEIAAHLRRARGLPCDAGQVIVTAGTAHALLTLALTVRDRRAGAIVEDPCVGFIPQILRRSGLRLSPVPVDDGGLVTAKLPRRPAANLAVVSPAHQFPLGGTLPIQRRLELLAYARRHRLLLVEDDYDAEFRFEGAPVSSLFQLDPGRVVHLGTFSKSLSPALRLGYMVLPPALVGPVNDVIAATHLTGSALTQAAFARLMHDGRLERHLLRMKRLYQRRARALEFELIRRFGATVEISGNTTGLHLVARFKGAAGRRLRRERLAACGVEADFVDDFAVGRAKHSRALVLGYGNLELDEIRLGVERLAHALGPAATV